MKTCDGRNFNSLASLCSLGDWFETRSVGNPEDRFYRDEAHMFPDKGQVAENSKQSEKIFFLV